LNFKDQKIYVGIDVHLRSWTVTILTEKLQHKTFSQDPLLSVAKIK
jgi:transposase